MIFHFGLYSSFENENLAKNALKKDFFSCSSHIIVSPLHTISAQTRYFGILTNVREKADDICECTRIMCVIIITQIICVCFFLLISTHSHNKWLHFSYWFIHTGKDKLGVPASEPVRVVLECDGTQIEDGEYFRTLANNSVLLLLRQGERWYPTGVDVIKAGTYQ